MTSSMAVIGAGASGLASLWAFEKAQRAGAKKPEIVCYEKQSDCGGLWNYVWRTGLDEFGEPVHSGIVVRWVEFDDKSDKFTVTVKDLQSDIVHTEQFDWVVVATGHFSIPNYPEFPGMDSFPGRVVHSHDFRNAADFAGKRVLIIGRSYSAEDIAIQCFKYSCQSVTISYRSRPFGFKWPDGITEKPLLRELRDATAYFVDGSSADVDAIIMCTGYQHHFPFLSDHLRLKTANVWYPLGLYKGIFWHHNTKSIYLGMQNQWFTFPLFDAQAWYARDVILGKIKLPKVEERENDMAKWSGREQAWTQAEKDAGVFMFFQADYMRDLLDATDYPQFDIDGMIRIFEDWERHKREKEGVLEYRDHTHRSVMTDTTARIHHTKWLHEMDDTLENFVH
ncbi:senecionine N-oxygenase-like [Paramacrobiotus metropolitanus]|uniref:senecionine N-oxygenase-like n=1 Tax=Paramacrobiotus metropolitanus TaxID=2943436 RepID=UPI00244598C9|nr:senecionine N-oxygenase-like [Paramacrobiotus metropolitanus]